MKHHTLPVISGLLLLTSAPLCYSVSLPTGQPQPNMFYYNCYYIFWAQRKTALAICVHHTSKNICIKKNCIECIVCCRSFLKINIIIIILKNVPKPAMQFHNVEEFLQMYDLVTFNLVCPITITMSSYYYVFIS